VRRLIVNADDFGISDGATEAIVDAHLHGIVTSTSVMANMPGFDSTLRLRERAPDLGYGAHLSLNVGRPLLGPHAVPSLCDGNGWLHGSFATHAFRSRRAQYRTEARRELTAQLECLVDHGFKPDHLNGQSHIQMIPALYAIFRNLQAAFSIPFLRTTGEPFRGQPHLAVGGIVKNAVVRTCARFCDTSSETIPSIGLIQTGHMDERNMLHYLQRLSAPATEWMVHPGTGKIADFSQFQRWVSDYLVLPDRVTEREALKSRHLREEIRRAGVELVTFAQLR
jgi:hypothetical protein